jgi:hypothetical protein
MKMKTKTIGQCKNCAFYEEAGPDRGLDDCSHIGATKYLNPNSASYSNFGCWYWKEKKAAKRMAQEVLF